MQIERAIPLPRDRRPAAESGAGLKASLAPSHTASATSSLGRIRAAARPTLRAATMAEPRIAPNAAKPARRGQPFRDAEACIFWMIEALAAAAETKRRMPPAICTPGDIVKCLDTLYRRRRIDLHHVRILRLWGHRGRAPNAADPREKADWRIWREALDRLDWPLRAQGIVS